MLVDKPPSALFASLDKSGKEGIFASCLYDFTKDFAYNCQKNYPEITLPFERKQPSGSLLGYPIASPIGIPACAIMTSRGIQWAAQAGFDILTYKTVRSFPFEGHPLPHAVLLEDPTTSCETYSITIANSMGIPSLPLDLVLQDIAKARSFLLPGQILIVSIIGNPSEEKTLEQDFAFLARAVSDAGAHIVEANLSCPNVHSSLTTYKDPVAVSMITEAICKAVPEIPVILKVGLFDSCQQMKDVFKAAASAGAKGICGINSVPMEIMDKEGNSAFGKNRPVAGVSGNNIRPLARQFILEARQIIQEENLGLVLLATGGIMQPEHFHLFLQAGADIALSATGAMWNPNLAIEFHQ